MSIALIIKATMPNQFRRDLNNSNVRFGCVSSVEVP